MGVDNPQHQSRVPDAAMRPEPINGLVPPEGVMSVMEAYERLKKLVESAADDVQKTEGGNKAAGTRVRKIMQDVKQAAQDVRVAVLGSRTTAES
jgi:hypothetical protein